MSALAAWQRRLAVILPAVGFGILFLLLWQWFVDRARHQAVPAAEAVRHLAPDQPSTRPRSCKAAARSPAPTRSSG